MRGVKRSTTSLADDEGNDDDGARRKTNDVGDEEAEPWQWSGTGVEDGGDDCGRGKEALVEEEEEQEKVEAFGHFRQLVSTRKHVLAPFKALDE